MMWICGWHVPYFLISFTITKSDLNRWCSWKMNVNVWKSLGLNWSKKFCHQPPKTIGCPCWLCQFCHLFLLVLSMHTLGGSCRWNAVLCHRTSNSDSGSDYSSSSSFDWWPSNRWLCQKRCLASSWVAGWWRTTTAACPQAENVIT